MKELHVYMYTPKSLFKPQLYSYLFDDHTVYVSFKDTEEAIVRGEETIHTTITHFLSFQYEGYRLFIHLTPDHFEECVIGSKNTWTNRDIGYAHNLEKMLLAGAMGEWLDGLL